MPPSEPSRRPTSRVPRMLRAVRRRAVLHRRPLAALAAGASVLFALQTLRPPPPDQMSVTVAARDLPAGTLLRADDLRHERRTLADLPAGYLETAAGETLASPVRSGETLTDARVLGPGLSLGSVDSVAFSVRITDAISVDLVRLGDRVDVIAVPAPGVEAGPGEGRVVVSGVPVLALPRDPEGPTGAAPGVENGRVVVLEIPRDARVKFSEAAARDWLTLARTQ